MVVLLAVITAKAQLRFERYPCITNPRAVKPLRTRFVNYDPDRRWDPERVYRQIVLLVSFSNMDFTMDDPQAYYNDLFNMRGFSGERHAPGSVADYFRDQSSGMFNLQFDVFGPVKIDQKAENTNQGYSAFRLATRQFVESVDIDFSPYDWDGDKEVDQIVIVTAGYCANGSNGTKDGFLWPNTGLFSSVMSHDGYSLSNYSATAEKWFNGIPCGLGTICHEFSHILGLPDLYPTDRRVMSVVDEWDLMDGGNYTCWGWNPPNYSAMEKLLMGWLTPEDITGPGSVSDMRPLTDGGTAYRSVIAGDEYYLLENRQRNGWDAGLPGYGLFITYTNFDANIWRYNDVNPSRGPYRYDIIHADGMDYKAWEAYIKENKLTEYEDDGNRFRRHYLSTSPYPFVSDTGEVRECQLKPYAFTNIQMTDDGIISFDIVDGETGIREVRREGVGSEEWYDLSGRRLTVSPRKPGIYIIRDVNGKTKKITR